MVDLGDEGVGVTSALQFEAYVVEDEDVLVLAVCLVEEEGDLLLPAKARADLLHLDVDLVAHVPVVGLLHEGLEHDQVPAGLLIWGLQDHGPILIVGNPRVSKRRADIHACVR